jgi:hypothetical protein
VRTAEGTGNAIDDFSPKSWLQSKLPSIDGVRLLRSLEEPSKNC